MTLTVFESTACKYPQAFENLWLIFPKRLGANPKYAAYVAWRRACKVASPDEIYAKAGEYVAFEAPADVQFVPMLMNWLKQRRWGNETITEKSQGTFAL